ncbi:hypothetical protein ONJ17_26550, partial [Salmonella enterica subsp. enterica serovar Agona]|nr:hypothetical protein [Salmonella enterica subsp. enterica serovar Agona]
LNDLDADVVWAQGREVKTIFIGGGTPSLLSGPAMQTLLDGVRAKLRNVGLPLYLPAGAAPNLSLILGGAGARLDEMAAAYSAFA